MNTKVAVLGASGMLGHKMLQILSDKFEVVGTLRKRDVPEILYPYCIYVNVDAMNFSTVSNALNDINPDIIVNCIGIIKQLPESNDWHISHTINSELPHKLAIYAHLHGMRLIHFSTDCVFDGKVGMYGETAIPNAIDIYGRTKFAGEVIDSLTLRTSIIGREIDSNHGLLEWFLSKKGMKIQGYKKSIFSGVTTNELSYLIGDIILNDKDIKGLYNVASTPINKYDLLTLVNKYLVNKVDIDPVDGEDINRSLNGLKLKLATGYDPPSWSDMIDEMMNKDKTDYGRF